MKFSCEKALLQDAITVSSRAVSPKSAYAALEGILVETAEDSLRLTGYDLSLGIRTTIPAQIREEGSTVLPARLFGDIVRRLADETVTLQTEKSGVQIKCGLSEFNISSIQAEDFPELPDVEKLNTVELSQRDLREMISQTVFAVSDNESRPIHTGSLFEVDPKEKKLTVVSVDGYRLALRRQDVSQSDGEVPFSFVVPGTALGEVERICGDSDEPVRVIQGPRHILFEIENHILVTRRLEGEFLNYRQAIPQENPVQVTADRRTLLQSIDRVSLIITEKQKSPIRCVFSDGLLQIRSMTAIGSAYDECPLDGDGGGLEIGFNSRYLQEALRAISEDSVVLQLNTPISPCIITPAEGDAFLHMVLPVRIRSEH